MPSARLLLIAAIAVCAGCVSVKEEKTVAAKGENGTKPSSGSSEAKADGDAAKDREKANKRAALERDLAISREKLQRAQANLEAEKASSQAQLAKAEAQLELSETELETFQTYAAPSRLAKARLDLQNVRDSVDEAAEELAQIEMMYKDSELADKTKEIVIRRNQRQLERAKARLALQETDAKTLESRTLPHERSKLELDVTEKRRELERTQRATEASLHEKRIALMSAESDIARLEAELAAQKEMA